MGGSPSNFSQSIHSRTRALSLLSVAMQVVEGVFTFPESDGFDRLVRRHHSTAVDDGRGCP
jgi:hypothetical protein